MVVFDHGAVIHSTDWRGDFIVFWEKSLTRSVPILLTAQCSPAKGKLLSFVEVHYISTKFNVILFIYFFINFLV